MIGTQFTVSRDMFQPSLVYSQHIYIQPFLHRAWNFRSWLRLVHHDLLRHEMKVQENKKRVVVLVRLRRKQVLAEKKKSDLCKKYSALKNRYKELSDLVASASGLSS